MSRNLRVYRRDLALYALAGSSEPLMASELADYMVELTRSEAHPDHCRSGIDSATASGVLRSLSNEKLVVQDGEKTDRRAGRPAPTWKYAMGKEAAKRVRMPEPPPSGAPLTSQLRGQEQKEDPYEGLNRTQMYALLEVGDMAIQELARLQQESMQILQRTSEFASRVRLKLVAAGLEDRLP